MLDLVLPNESTNFETTTTLGTPNMQGEVGDFSTVIPIATGIAIKSTEILIDQGMLDLSNLFATSKQVGGVVSGFKVAGKHKEIVTHIEYIVGEVTGNVHIQINGASDKVVIDRNLDFASQIKKLAKGTKQAIEQVAQNIEKGFQELDNLQN